MEFLKALRDYGKHVKRNCEEECTFSHKSGITPALSRRPVITTTVCVPITASLIVIVQWHICGEKVRAVPRTTLHARLSHFFLALAYCTIATSSAYLQARYNRTEAAETMLAAEKTARVPSALQSRSARH